MPHSKKLQNSWRCSISNVILGVCISVYPVILLHSFLWAFFYIFVLSTVSSLNAISVTKKIIPFPLAVPLNSVEENRHERTSSKKAEFSLLKCAFAIVFMILLYYVLSVLFGAPLLELYTSTLYFSCLMTLLTTYPLLWFFYSTDNLAAVLRIFSDLRFESVTENHFYLFTVWPILGAWIGAFPIPLDWDRPWQEWPITCCIGASLGYALAHFLMAGRLLSILYYEKKKSTTNRPV